MDKLENETCPFCKKKALTLMEGEKDIPNFGKYFIYSMKCSNCDYNKSDVEASEKKEPVKYTFEIENKKDLNIMVVKSSEATIKVPGLKITLKPGPATFGYIMNIKDLLQQFKKIIENQRDNEEESAIKKKSKNLLKKIWKIECGDEKLKIIVEDPTGNSIIVSEKVKTEKLK